MLCFPESSVDSRFSHAVGLSLGSSPSAPPRPSEAPPTPPHADSCPADPHIDALSPVGSRSATPRTRTSAQEATSLPRVNANTTVSPPEAR